MKSAKTKTAKAKSRVTTKQQAKRRLQRIRAGHWPFNVHRDGLCYIGGSESGIVAVNGMAIIFPSERDAREVVRRMRGELPADYHVQYVPPAELDYWLDDLQAQREVGVCLGLDGQNMLLIPFPLAA